MRFWTSARSFITESVWNTWATQSHILFLWHLMKEESPVVEFLLLDSPQRPLKLPLTLNEKHSFRRYNTSNSIAQLNWIFDPGNVSTRLNGTMVRQNRKGWVKPTAVLKCCSRQLLSQCLLNLPQCIRTQTHLFLRDSVLSMICGKKQVDNSHLRKHRLWSKAGCRSDLQTGTML